jgi:hypothetical protein
MNVKELITELQRFDAESDVYVYRPDEMDEYAYEGGVSRRFKIIPLAVGIESVSPMAGNEPAVLLETEEL